MRIVGRDLGVAFAIDRVAGRVVGRVTDRVAKSVTESVAPGVVVGERMAPGDEQARHA